LGVTFDNYTLGRATAVWCDLRWQFARAGENVEPCGNQRRKRRAREHGLPGRTGCFTASPL